MADVLFIFGLVTYVMGCISGVLIALLQLKKKVFLENKVVAARVLDKKAEKLLNE